MPRTSAIGETNSVSYHRQQPRTWGLTSTFSSFPLVDTDVVTTRVHIFVLHASYIRASCDKSDARFPRIKSAVHLVVSGTARPPCKSLFSLHTCRQHISSLSSLVPDDSTTYCSNTLLTISILQLILSCCLSGKFCLLLAILAYAISKQPTPSSCNHCVRSVTASLLTVEIASNGPLTVEHTLGTLDQDSAILGLGGFHPVVEHLCPTPSKLESWLYRCEGQTPDASVVQRLTLGRD